MLDNPDLRIYEDFLPLIAKKQITLQDLKKSSFRELWNLQAMSDIATFIEIKQTEDYRAEQESKSNQK